MLWEHLYNLIMTISLAIYFFKRQFWPLTSVDSYPVFSSVRTMHWMWRKTHFYLLLLQFGIPHTCRLLLITRNTHFFIYCIIVTVVSSVHHCNVYSKYDAAFKLFLFLATLQWFQWFSVWFKDYSGSKLHIDFQVHLLIKGRSLSKHILQSNAFI